MLARRLCVAGVPRRLSPSRLSHTAVVLMTGCGPAKAVDLPAFVEQLNEDSDLTGVTHTPESYKALYAQFGGHAASTVWVARQCEALQERLSSTHHTFKCYPFHRYLDNSETLAALRDDKPARGVVVSTMPHFSCGLFGAWARAALPAITQHGGQWAIADRWGSAPGYAHAVAKSVRDTLDQLPYYRRRRAMLLFAAPLPARPNTPTGDPYAGEVAATVHQVMAHLRFSHPFAITWFPAPGQDAPASHTPLLSDALSASSTADRDTAVVVPLGPLHETPEVLDLARPREGHIRTVRYVPAFNATQAAVKILGDVAKDALADAELSSPQYKFTCFACPTPTLCRPSPA